MPPPAPSGIPGASEAGDQFGAAVEWGRLDLYVGNPGENAAAGTIVVIPGAATLPVASAFVVSQNTAGVAGSAEAGDRFGAALSYHTFSFTGEPTMAVGVPGEDVGTIKDAGAVSVLATGFFPNDHSINQNSPSVPGIAQAGEHFGAALG